MPKQQPTGTPSVDDLRMLRIEEVASRMGLTTRSVERLSAAGKGPQITVLSARRRGIRMDHFRDWLTTREKTNTAV